MFRAWRKGIALAALFAFLVGVAPARAAEENYDPQHTMLTLNMAIVSIHKILSRLRGL